MPLVDDVKICQILHKIQTNIDFSIYDFVSDDSDCVSIDNITCYPRKHLYALNKSGSSAICFLISANHAISLMKINLPAMRWRGTFVWSSDETYQYRFFDLWSWWWWLRLCKHRKYHLLPEEKSLHLRYLRVEPFSSWNSELFDKSSEINLLAMRRRAYSRRCHW